MSFRGFIVFSLLVIVSIQGFSQDNKQLAEQLVEIGDEILRSTYAYSQAREQYLQALENDPDNIKANYMAGEMFLVSTDKEEAKPYYLKTLELDPDYKFDLLYKIGLSAHYGLEFDEAIDYYNQYIDKVKATTEIPRRNFVTIQTVERKIYECGIGKELVESPRQVEVKNLGAGVNSEFDDYAPVLNQDETLLIFTSRRLNGNLSEDVDSDNLYFEDIFMSRKEGETWSSATNIGENVNTPGHDSNLALSRDGVRLYVYNSDINNGDIFVSTQAEDGSWSPVERMPEPINSEYNENGVSLSEDGTLLFFSSNRPGGNGGYDIYLSELAKSGNWKNPKNLGTLINTEFNEESPFLSFDNKTLYFASQGGRGMGGFDVFQSEYDSIAETWGVPENIGYPINTPDEDFHFAPTEDGFRAYYATTREDGYGETDIYEVTFIDEEPVAEKPELPGLVLVVTVTDGETGEVLESEVTIEKVGSDSTQVGSPYEGNYFFGIPHEESEYILTAEKVGYAFYDRNIKFYGDPMDTSYLHQEIRLFKLQRGYTMVLRNIYFDFNEATLIESSFTELNKVVKLMQQNPSLEIAILGHTDNVGTEAYNEKLSKDRAESVKSFITSQNIGTSRISTVGYGAKYPLASNDDEFEGRELNRRVEMKVVEFTGDEGIVPVEQVISDGMQEVTHVVKASETLYSLARRYQTTVEQIRAANQLSTVESIQVDQELTIYVPNDFNLPEEITYEVKAGDTMFSIAQKFGVSIDDLKSWNNKDSNSLSIGETLTVKNY